MWKRRNNPVKSVLLISVITIIFVISSAKSHTPRFCGTESSTAATDSILNSQREVFGRPLYEIDSKSERANLMREISFPEGVGIKVRVVNCAGYRYSGFTKSMLKLNDGFQEAGINFIFDGDSDACNQQEMNQIAAHCTSSTSADSIGIAISNDCPNKALDPISNRIQYNDGLLVLVIDAPGYSGGQADLGFLRDNPWVMVQIDTLPEVTAAYFIPSGPVENLGVVLVHEIGHALGLHHTFLNGCSFPGDYIPDTPYESLPLAGQEYVQVLECCAQRPTSECSPAPTCENAGRNNYDNFMDYSPDSCRNRFTTDQVAAMQATLLDKRPRWLGLEKPPQIIDIEMNKILVEGTNTIQGNFRDGTDVPLGSILTFNCPADSIWKMLFQYNPGVLAQPKKKVFRINIPTPTQSIQVTQCNASNGVSLTYLECKFSTGSAGTNCKCQVSGCSVDTEGSLIKINPMNWADYYQYLIVSNDQYADNDLSFSIDIAVEMKQLQPPPMGPIQSPPVNLPPSVSESAPDGSSESIPSGIYTFGPTVGSCRGQYISANPGRKCQTSVRLRNFRQASSNSSILRWRLINGQILESLAASQKFCKSKNLAAAKSGAKLGGNAWKWKIQVIRRNGNGLVVNLISKNKRGGSSYLKVNNDCSLSFTSNNIDKAQFEAIDYTFLGD